MKKITYTLGELLHQETQLSFILELPARQMPSGQTKRVGIFLCRCGSLVEAHIANVKSGQSSSCGCKRKQTLSKLFTRHGMRSHPLYMTWWNMVQRCSNPASHDYKWYGKRGITVCDRWLGEDGLRNFVADMGNRPDGHTLDRIRNNKGYFPGNCRWVDMSTQTFNQRVKSSNTSGHRGVHWSNRYHKWGVQLVINGQHIWGGYFEEKTSAIQARHELEIMHRGYAIDEEGAPINDEEKEA